MHPIHHQWPIWRRRRKQQLPLLQEGSPTSKEEGGSQLCDGGSMWTLGHFEHSEPLSWFLLQHTCHHSRCRFHTFHIPCHFEHSEPSSWFLLQHTCHHNHCPFHTFHIPCLWNLL